jgi:hypothetical protein
MDKRLDDYAKYRHFWGSQEVLSINNSTPVKAICDFGEYSPSMSLHEKVDLYMKILSWK